jgi:hypothetical protein
MGDTALYRTRWPSNARRVYNSFGVTPMVDAPALRSAWLRTPPLPLLVDPTVFDEFGWAPSTRLGWRCLGPLTRGPISEDPARMAFVLSRSIAGVPTELARLHVGRAYGLSDEHCVAPYAIDEATDELWRQRIVPADALWLAADNLDALYWGLHDWAHFHNHGDFVERAANELQCDLSALCWLWLNRDEIGLAPREWSDVRESALALHRRRCATDPPGVALDEGWLRDEPRLCRLAEGLVVTQPE